MEDDPEPHQLTFFELLIDGGPVQLFAILFAVFCTVWLVTSRIRRCIRFCPPTHVRDVVLLSVGPVCAVLLSLCRAATNTMAFMAGGLDSDFALRYGLNDIAVICSVAFFCFVPGVISFLLPAKTEDAKPDSKPHSTKDEGGRAP